MLKTVLHVSFVAWCYHSPSCSEITWAKTPGCNGTQQSPIDINTGNVQANANLTAFSFAGFNERSALTEITNTGTTVLVSLDHMKMWVAGGDLPAVFSSIEIHFHWGNGSSVPGSEHTVNGKRYPMELHIVNKALHTGIKSGDSLAVLGVFIEASTETGKPESWKTLTSYLAKIANAGDKVRVFPNISMDDLLLGVNRNKYYRYMGSLTTPNCKEGIDLFSRTVYINTSRNSPLMLNTFRSIQPIGGRVVATQEAGSKINPQSGASTHSWIAMCPLLSLLVMWGIMC
ncbi:hypothetical protein DNTS_007597 [Danionella cerebrum]|uniref:Carbonic anhydrase n=1 Tax=Danionella cerebrum TaxID=2873325 RepID=A0A553PYF0_9TELE|nr:hypothetical protein DNTS_007597 [Danionella translucida]